MKQAKMLLLALAAGCATAGSTETSTPADQALEQEVGAKAGGTIVWSSARAGNHHLFLMNTDGSNVRQITRGDTVDWFPRFSPDGSKILFTRSTKGGVREDDANGADKWDIWTVSGDGTDETKVVENASWGGWLSADAIIYVRGTKILRRALPGGDESVIMDSQGVADLDGALLQQPEMSRDGKYLAITLGGSRRETGVWNVETKTWTATGLGSQINWTPDGERIYWVNPTGNGGSQVFAEAMKGGKPAKVGVPDRDLQLMDLPGRRSRESFPQLSADGKWMVWGATQRGEDHDTADYEIYLWEVGSPREKAARLTFHAANDRWPDIFTPAAAALTSRPKSADEPPRPGPPAATPAIASATDPKPAAAAPTKARKKVKAAKKKARKRLVAQKRRHR